MRRGGGENLQRHGTMEVCVVGRLCGEEVVSADIHDEEGVVGDEAEAVSAGSEPVPAYLDR